MIYVLLYKTLDFIFQALYFALIIRVLLSWVPHDPYHAIVQWIYRLTDPILQPFQDIIPTHRIGIDLSPIFAFIALGFVRKTLYMILF